jgi:hypothetical protein
VFRNIYGGLPGIVAALLIGPIFYLLGSYSFYGLEYLQFLPWLIPGQWLTHFVSISVGCLLYHYIVSRQTKPRDLARQSVLPPQDTSAHAVALAAVILAAFAFIYVLLRYYFDAWCVFLKAPIAAMLVFVIFLWALPTWIRRKRDQFKVRAAFAILLASEVAFMFATGQVLALDHFRKGLQRHTQGVGQSEIASSPRARFFIDYDRKEFAFVWRSERNRPDYRHPFPSGICL